MNANKEDLFSIAFNLSPSASVIISLKDEKFRDANEAFCILAGYSREEIIGHNAADLGIWSPEESAKVFDIIRKQRKVKNLQADYFIRTRDKHTALFSAECFTADNEQHAIVFINDITQGKQIAEKLQRSESQYRELIDSLPQIIFELNSKGDFTYVQHNAIRTTGYSRKDFETGLKIIQVFVPEDQERLRQNIEKRFAGEISGGNKYTLRRKDGSTFHALIYSVPIVDQNRIIGLRGIAVELPGLIKENTPEV